MGGSKRALWHAKKYMESGTCTGNLDHSPSKHSPKIRPVTMDDCKRLGDATCLTEDVFCVVRG